MAGRDLVVFLSLGGSLTKWQAQNILTREMELYLTYASRGLFDRIRLFSYDNRDRALLERLRGADARYAAVEVLTPGALGRAGAPGRGLYSILGPLLHRGPLRRATCLKTNQISGSWAAVIGRLACGRPLLLRAGYVLSDRFGKEGQTLRQRIAQSAEWLAARAANRIVVTSKAAEAALGASTGQADKVFCIPTYVDVDRFKPVERYDFSKPLLFVGRLEPQKNLINLVKAGIEAGLPIDLVGSGSLEGAVRDLAASAPAPIRILDPMPNEVLAERMRDYAVFALPSLHEGLPKVLIEAMASGLVCVGTDIPGTNDLITDGETGYLIPTPEVADIVAAFRRVMEERDEGVGRAARALIARDFSLGAYIDKEYQAFRSVAALDVA